MFLIGIYRLLFGERPYWWVKESPLFSSPSSRLTLNQNAMTCETGPGSPSGHVMANLTLWLVLWDVLYKRVVEKNFGEGYKTRRIAAEPLVRLQVYF